MADGINRPDADEEFDRVPRKAKRSGNGPLIAMIVVGALLIGGLIFVLAYFLSGSNNLDREMLAYLPADTDAMIGIEVEQLLKNDKLKSLLNKAKDTPDSQGVMGKLKEAGITENDISRILVGGKFSSIFEPRVIAVNGKKVDKQQDGPMVSTVVRFKKAIDKAKLASVMKAAEQNKNGKTYYKKSEFVDHFVYFPTDSVMVYTDSEKLLDTLLTKDPSQVVVSEEMQELSRKMSKGQIWFAVGRSAFGDKLKGISEHKDEMLPTDLLPAIEGMKGVGVHLKLDDDEFELGARVLCADSTAARKASDGLERWIKEHLGKSLDQHKLVGARIGEMEKAQQNLIDELRKSVEADHNGDMLELKLEFRVSKIEELFKGVMQYWMAPMQQGELHIKPEVKIEHAPKIGKLEPGPHVHTEEDLKEPKLLSPDPKKQDTIPAPKKTESKPKAPSE